MFGLKWKASTFNIVHVKNLKKSKRNKGKIDSRNTNERNKHDYTEKYFNIIVLIQYFFVTSVF